MVDEYKPKYADPNDYARMKFPVKDTHLTAICESYLLQTLGIWTKDGFDKWRRNVEKQWKEAESNWFEKIVGYLYYKLILPKANELTNPKKLFFVLSKLDKTIKYLPPGYWIPIIKGIDWIADIVYENLD